MDELVLSDTLAYMKEEQELKNWVRNHLIQELQKALHRKASWMGIDYDDSNESYLDREQANQQAKTGRIPEEKLRLMFNKLDLDNSGGVTLKVGVDVLHNA
jgi:hypothetical protein